MISWITNQLKASISGRVEPMARRDVSELLAKNLTIQEHRYGLLFRPLLWGADRPVKFTLLLAALAILFAEILAKSRLGGWIGVFNLEIRSDFDAAAYIDVPWSIQATFVALVYPIVLSFVALLLQRKSHSAVAMRVYLLESAVVPAGTSAVGLLIAMGLQYFLTPYASLAELKRWMPELLLMNGTWFIANLVLAGVFVSRTVRFLDAKEQASAYKRVAVDIVLRREQIGAISRRLYSSMSSLDWGFPSSGDDSAAGPRVELGFGRSGNPHITKEVRGVYQLRDVRTRILRAAVGLWVRRARASTGPSGKRPTISFPLQIGVEATGRFTLCEVEDGPALSSLEKLLVRAAFVYGRKPSQALTSKDVLGELAAEVVSLAEQEKHSEANEALSGLIDLHRTLLSAGAMEPNGTPWNVALESSSPYGYRSYAEEWMDHYAGVARVAVKSINSNTRLLSGLVSAPMRLASRQAAKPQKIHKELLRIGRFVSYELMAWWQRQADAHRVAADAPFLGVLPPPLSKVYESALVAHIGADFQFRAKLPKDAPVERTWERKSADALDMADRIDERAIELLRAVDQGDVAAAEWFTDSFLKWRETRYPRRLMAKPNDVNFQKLNLELAGLDWAGAKAFLWQGGDQVSIDYACDLMDVAVHNYWLSVRVAIVTTLVHEVGDDADHDSLALRIAAAILTATPLKPGGSPTGFPLDDFDSVFSIMLRNLFGKAGDAHRIDRLGERRRRANDEPVVPGWVYMFSGASSQFSSMHDALARLLVTSVKSRPSAIACCRRQIENLWNDLDTLEQIKNYCQDLRRRILDAHFHGGTGTVEALSHHIGRRDHLRCQTVGAYESLKRLAKRADYERLTTLRSRPIDTELLNAWAQDISVTGIDTLPVALLPGARVHFSAGSGGRLVAIKVTAKKSWFIKDAPSSDREIMASSVQGELKEALIGEAAVGLLLGYREINSETMHDYVDPQSGQAQVFLSTLAQEIQKVRQAGGNPVVLVGELGWHLNHMMWGDTHFQYAPVAGVTIRAGEAHRDSLSAISFVNDAPVYEHITLDGNCYVVEESLLTQLSIRGGDAASAVRMTWSHVDYEHVEIRLEWVVRYDAMALP